MIKEQRKKILQTLKKEHLAVLSTAFKDAPEAAVIDFSETKNLEIIFTTLVSYRKYKILKKNSKVALVFGGERKLTIQYEGKAKEIGRVKCLPYMKYHFKKNPIEIKFAKMLEARFFKITPTWIRYADYVANPNEIFEIKF